HAALDEEGSSCNTSKIRPVRHQRFWPHRDVPSAMRLTKLEKISSRARCPMVSIDASQFSHDRKSAPRMTNLKRSVLQLGQSSALSNKTPRIQRTCEYERDREYLARPLA